ncbi:YwqG family protein [Winogradskyella sp. PE311]|uniref:YwqG family protein n=1 Tax=Winogradskyella sp. PE311 TaxID=3366943 RepID=UPI00397EDA33
MIPEFLKNFEPDLKKYEREFIRIKAKPRKEKLLEDNLNLKESKFLGKPFFPLDKEYPKDENGKSMIMVAQLNFEQIPELDSFPKNGILQLFLSATDWYQEDFAIIYHTVEELSKEPLNDFSFITEKDYEEMPVFKLHQLSFEKGIDKGGSEDSQFDYLFNGIDYWDFTEKLTEQQEELFGKYFDATGHKIGGYAEFTQSDPRDYNADQRDDIQVLQIDVDDQIMFGDSGLGHIFISKENLIKKDFTKAYFYWDCC